MSHAIGQGYITVNNNTDLCQFTDFVPNKEPLESERQQNICLDYLNALCGQHLLVCLINLLPNNTVARQQVYK